MRLIEQSAKTIFGSLPTAIEYANRLHKPDRPWCVYKLPGREQFTLCLARDVHSDRSPTYNGHGRRLTFQPFDRRCIVYTTGGD